MLYFARWKITLVVAVCLIGLIFFAPNFLPRATVDQAPSWLPHEQISLGLDLQGGSHLLLEVDVGALIHERLETTIDSIRGALREDDIGYAGLGITDGAVQVAVRDPAQIVEARRLLNELNGPVGGGLLGSVGATEFDILEQDGTFIFRLTEPAIEARRTQAIDQSIEIVSRRIDETGTREPTIQRQGADRILVQLPGVRDPDRIKRLLGKTAKLTFRLVHDALSATDAEAGRVPAGYEIVPSDEAAAGGGEVPRYLVQKRAMVSGEMLVSAQPGFDQQTGQPIVSFRFDSVGARRFGEVTKENVGRPFAIVLDGKVISAPVIREPILGGAGQISGQFTVEEANDLAILLRAGALPAPLQVIEERSVGPDLGSDSIAQGQVAGVVAFLLVIAFMLTVYGLFGLFANVALIINMVLMGAVLSGLQATLTLPGIAGVVLTIGMAVDANVLIYERIREETRAGKTPFAAIEAGYRRAMATIIDSNLTTIFATVLLYLFGSGPVKGFAVTLTIGVVTSMFTAVTVSRLLVVLWLRRRRPAALAL